jgi:glutaredoxin
VSCQYLTSEAKAVLLISDVVVWSLPSCVQCNAVKRTLTKKGVEYEERDLSLDEHADKLTEFKDKGFLGAPVVTVGGVPRFCEFNVTEIENIFG